MSVRVVPSPDSRMTSLWSRTTRGALTGWKRRVRLTRPQPWPVAGIAGLAAPVPPSSPPARSVAVFTSSAFVMAGEGTSVPLP